MFVTRRRYLQVCEALETANATITALNRNSGITTITVPVSMPLEEIARIHAKLNKKVKILRAAR